METSGTPLQHLFDCAVMDRKLKELEKPLARH